MGKNTYRAYSLFVRDLGEKGGISVLKRRMEKPANGMIK